MKTLIEEIEKIPCPPSGLVLIPHVVLVALIKAWNKMKKLGMIGVLLLAWTTLAQSSNTCSVTLAWDPSPETNVAKYVLYQGQASKQYNRVIEVTNRVNGVLTTTNKVDGLAPATTFYFVVTARSVSGLESPPSNEIAYTTPAFYQPPVNLRVTATNESWRVTVTLDKP